MYAVAETVFSKNCDNASLSDIISGRSRSPYRNRKTQAIMTFAIGPAAAVIAVSRFGCLKLR